MAEFTPKKIVLEDINNGIEFTESDGVTPNAINDPIEAVAYSQTVVEHLTDTPDTSEINGVGNPNVSFVSNTTADGVTIHKFKFSNLSGATFTPSLDEAGNLSWSNNRNLPNPPTINISGRDYLFSSEVLSGTYIPQVNSEVTDMPLTSFNRAPVDDIDHCYLFYYYTPENIYYWLATQVVDIQETTATLKILSVVRLTGYTPTIGKNGNWFIGGDDTGKPSYGASGVTDVVAGASYNQNDFTITPLTFNFEVGNSKTVNVKAAIGNVENAGTKVYVNNALQARLGFTSDPQTQINGINTDISEINTQLSEDVVRTDEAQDLTETQKKTFAANMGKPYGAKYSGGWMKMAVLKRTASGASALYAVFLISSSNNPMAYGLLKVSAYTTASSLYDQSIELISLSSSGLNPSVIRGVYDNSDNSITIYVKGSAAYNAITLQTISNCGLEPFDITIDPENVTTGPTANITCTWGRIEASSFVQDGHNVALQDGTYADMTVGRATADGNGNNIPNTYATKAEATRTATYTQQGQVKMASTTNGGAITSGNSDDTVPTVKNICNWVRNNMLSSEVSPVESTEGSLTLPSKGWYYIRYAATSLILVDYATGVFYWDGSRELFLPVSYYYAVKTSRCVSISASGVIKVYDADTGEELSGARVTYYKLA